MISVIICSVSEVDFNNVKKNIEDTIGIEHEIIKTDNSAGKLSLCAAYNLGAARAKFEHLCFVHEDVAFITPNWGQLLIQHFNQVTNAGLLGIAGSVYKTRMCSGWWQYENGWDECRRMNLWQEYKNGRPGKTVVVNPFAEIRSEVAVIDGVFMATKKDIWERNKFDERLLKGFHGYDLDFSLKIGQSKKIFVVYDVLLNHFSGGTANITWVEDVLKVHKKWAHRLPVIIKNCDRGNVYENGWKRLRKNMQFFIDVQCGMAILIKRYTQFCMLLDKKPGMLTFIKDYFTGLGKLVQHYRQKKQQATD